MIGYYAHHRGSGHLHRAAAVAAHLGRRLTVLSSADPPGAVQHLRLAPDDEPPVSGDVTAAGALHWVPVQHKGLRERNSQIVRWAAEQDCSVLVSDISVEALLLARLLSIPAVAVTMRGRRLDRVHALGYDAASRIIAPWPRATQGPWPARWLDKTVWVGAVSRFDGRAKLAGRCARPGRCVVLLLGRGGDSMTDAVLREAAAVPDTHWHLLGGNRSANSRTRTASCSAVAASAGGDVADSMMSVERLGWVTDAWPLLCRADVVVAAPGDAAIADVAAAGRPLIAVPQARPYEEQRDHAAILVRHGLALSEPTWPGHDRWPRLLDRAVALGGAGWSAYSDGQGSARMAGALLELADGDGDDGGSGGSDTDRDDRGNGGRVDGGSGGSDIDRADRGNGGRVDGAGRGSHDGGGGGRHGSSDRRSMFAADVGSSAAVR